MLDRWASFMNVPMQRFSPVVPWSPGRTIAYATSGAGAPPTGGERKKVKKCLRGVEGWCYGSFNANWRNCV